MWKCEICKQPAVGYNYSVLSCNGCRLFFRRTVLNKQKYSCERVDSLAVCKQINSIAERQKRCKACRFQACIDAGMNPTDVMLKAEMSQAKKLKNKDESISSLSSESEFSSSTYNPSQTVNNPFTEFLQSNNF